MSAGLPPLGMAATGTSFHVYRCFLQGKYGYGLAVDGEPKEVKQGCIDTHIERTWYQPME